MATLDFRGKAFDVDKCKQIVTDFKDIPNMIRLQGRYNELSNSAIRHRSRTLQLQNQLKRSRERIKELKELQYLDGGPIPSAIKEELKLTEELFCETKKETNLIEETQAAHKLWMEAEIEKGKFEELHNMKDLEAQFGEKKVKLVEERLAKVKASTQSSCRSAAPKLTPFGSDSKESPRRTQLENREGILEYIAKKRALVTEKSVRRATQKWYHVEHRIECLESLKRELHDQKLEYLAEAEHRAKQKRHLDMKREEEKLRKKKAIAKGINPYLNEIRKRKENTEKTLRDQMKNKQKQHYTAIANKLYSEEIWAKTLLDRQAQDKKNIFKPKTTIMSKINSFNKRYRASIEALTHFDAKLLCKELPVELTDEANYCARSSDFIREETESEDEVELQAKLLSSKVDTEDKVEEHATAKNEEEAEAEIEEFDVKDILKELNSLKKQSKEEKPRPEDNKIKRKPETVLFKDFEVDKTHRKKISFLNSSTAGVFLKFHSIHVDDVEDDLDFVLENVLKVDFISANNLRPGLSTTATVIFTPSEAKDLKGTINFQTMNGAVSVPFVCETKRPLPRLSTDVVDFGEIVVGEHARQNITVRNDGSVICSVSVYRELPQPEPENKTRNVSTANENLLTVPVSKEQQHDLMPTESTHEATWSTFINYQKVVSILKKQSKPSESEATESADRSESNSSVKTKSRVHILNSARKKSRIFSSKSSGSSSTTTLIIPELDPIEIVKELLKEIEEAALETFKVDVLRNVSLDPKSSKNVEVKFSPPMPGHYETEFFFKFDPDSTLVLRILGKCRSFPVRVTNPHLDFGICKVEQLYQETFVITNEGRIPRRVVAILPAQVLKHTEVIPKYTYSQPGGKATITIRLKARHTVFEDSPNHYDRDTSILDIPIDLKVFTFGCRPEILHCSAQVVVASCELTFEPQEIDFGRCTPFETILADTILINKSLAVQKYAFLGVPKFVSIQPNGGFGTALPLEHIPLKFLYSPGQECLGLHRFELTCETGTGNTFNVSCMAEVVCPHVDFTQQVIRLPATSVGSMSSANVYIRSTPPESHFQSHRAKLRNPSFCGVMDVSNALWSFEFQVPSDAELIINPSYGHLSANQVLKVTILFQPTIPEGLIKERAAETERLKEQEKETLRLQQLVEEAKAKAKVNVQPLNTKKGVNKAIPRKSPSRSGVTSTYSPTARPSSLRLTSTTVMELFSPQSLFLADQQLRSEFTPEVRKYHIPCFIRTDFRKDSVPSEVSVLYLSVSCPVVRPGIVIHGVQKVFDFGTVGIGHRVSKDLVIENVSRRMLALSASQLDPVGPFRLGRALRTIKPAEKYTLRLTFKPHSETQSWECFEILALNTSLSFSLTGNAVLPKFEIVPNLDNEIDFGEVKMATTDSAEFQIRNKCEAELMFLVVFGDYEEVNEALLSTSSTAGKGKKDKQNSKGKLAKKSPTTKETKKDKSKKKKKENETDFDLDMSADCLLATPAPYTVFPRHLKVGPNATKKLHVKFMPNNTNLYKARFFLYLYLSELIGVISVKGKGSKK